MERTKVDCLCCGGEEFRISIEAGDCINIECTACRDRYCLGAWAGAPAGEGHGQDADGDAAVEGVGDVAADLVPAPQRRGRGRPPIGLTAMTSAERMRRLRARLRAGHGQGALL